MNELEQVAILGGGQAGANAAFALRERGFDGRVVIVGEEEQLPYERPPLSKGYLRGEESLAKATIRPQDYESNRIDLALGRRAVGLDRERRALELDDGQELVYDALLLATGAAPRRLDVPGANIAGVHYLRTVRDADEIRDHASRAGAIAVIGGGWIGSEVAASLRQLGHSVTLVSTLPRPLERVLGAEIAEVYRRLHEAHGVRLVHGKVTSLVGRQHVEEVVLSSGVVVQADMVVVGVGASARAELGERAGLEVAQDGGLAVDEFLRTSDPRIFAAGDVASPWHPRFHRRLRVEHWDNAIEQGRTAAANILGAGEPYRRTPYFYSDQFDLGMEYRGYAPQWDRVVVRGDAERYEFHAFWLADNRVVAAMNANLWDDGDDLLRMVESGSRVDVSVLADPAVPLARAA